MHFSQSKSDGIYRLWDNDMNLIASTKSYDRIRYLLAKYSKNKENYVCKCLLCKNGIEHSEK
jgi:hypothetical protein